MKLTGKPAFAAILIGCGALILLGKFGWMFGHLMSLIVPIAMLIFGYIGLVNGRKFIGGILMFFGIVCLLGKLSGLIGLLVGIAMIGVGVSLLKRRSVY